jgi:RepB plasmid partitioning protein
MAMDVFVSEQSIREPLSDDEGEHRAADAILHRLAVLLNALHFRPPYERRLLSKSLRMREKVRMLDGVAPEAVSILKDRQVIPKVFAALKKMKPMRQIEAAEMLVAAKRFTATYVNVILATTHPDGRTRGRLPV